MKETNQELADHLEFTLSLLKLVPGTEQGQVHQTPVGRDAEQIEKIVRALHPKQA